MKTFKERKPLKTRVSTKIHKAESGCWEWTSMLDTYGYGRIKVQRRWLKAHRVVFELETGQTLSVEQNLDHICTNKKCVNPSHLQIVTRGENVVLGWERGEYARSLTRERDTPVCGHDIQSWYKRPNGKSGYCRECRKLDRKAVWS